MIKMMKKYDFEQLESRNSSSTRVSNRIIPLLNLLHNTILYYTILYYTILHHTILY